jgi:hypothetical protein
METNRITAALNEFARCTVWHPDFEKAKRLIMKSIATTAERNDPSSTLLTGESGVGKTRLCLIINRDLGMPHMSDTEAHLKCVRPCVYLEVPPNATLKSVACEILTELVKTAEELADPESDVSDRYNFREYESMSLAKVEIMIIQRLRTLETTLLILDEFHHVADRGKDATKLTICNWLTNLLNKSKIAILLSGSTKITTIVNSVAELSGRYPYRATVRELDYCNEFDAPIFLSVLAGLEKEMIRIGELVDYIHLTDLKLYKAMRLATKGNFRALSDLLNDSFKIALTRGDNTLKIGDFIEAYEDLHLSEAGENPFEMSLEMLESIPLSVVKKNE